MLEALREDPKADADPLVLGLIGGADARGAGPADSPIAAAEVAGDADLLLVALHVFVAGRVELLVRRVVLELGALTLGGAEHLRVAVVGPAAAVATAVLRRGVAGVVELDEGAILDDTDLDALELDRAPLLEAGDAAEVRVDDDLLLERALAHADDDQREHEERAEAEDKEADDDVEPAFVLTRHREPSLG